MEAAVRLTNLGVGGGLDVDLNLLDEKRHHVLPPFHCREMESLLIGLGTRPSSTKRLDYQAMVHT